MSRKKRERQWAAQEQAPPAEPLSASSPPDGWELQSWPDYWRRYAELLLPAWLRVPDPAAPTIRFVPDQRHWSWGGSYTTLSATLLDEAIRWEEEWPDESSIDQPTAEFLAFGSPDDMAAPFVASDLREVIRAREPARWRELLAQAQALRWNALKQSGGAGTRNDSAASQPDYKRVSSFVWEWGDSADGYTAILSGDAISWNWHGPKDLGNSIGQSVVNFIASGPDEKNAPDALAWELFNAVRNRDPKRWSKLLTKANALQNRARSGGAEPPSGQRRSHPEAPAPRGQTSQAPDDEPPQPIGPLLLQGLAVIGASVAIALSIATVMPTLAKYAGIILPVLLGFAAAFRWGSLALIVAGFFGVAAGFGSQHAYERYAELARGVTATLTSISEAPRHPEATRFIATDARAALTLAGSMERTTVRQYGAGPRDERWSLQVMPLVPKAWNRSQPVPAWIACTTTPGFDCLRRMEDDVSRTIRVRDYTVDFFRTAIANAERRHGLASAPSAPVLEPFSDPIGAPEFYLAAAVLVPLAVYGLWAIIMIGWRTWRRTNTSPPAST